MVTKRNNVSHQHQQPQQQQPQPQQLSDVIVQDEDELVADYEQHPTQQAINNNGAASLNGELDEAEAMAVGQKLPFFKRALPPLPKTVSNGYADGAADSQLGEAGLANGIAPGSESPANSMHQAPQGRQMAADNSDEQANEDTSMDFAASIEKVKDVSRPDLITLSVAQAKAF